MRLASFVSTGVALLLVVGKGIAWHQTESVSLLSSLLDSALDLLASLITLLSVRYALTPADREHRFGHGKAEPLAGLIQAGFIGASGIWLLISAGERLLKPQPIQQETVGIAVMLGAIALTLALVVFQRWIVRRTGSIAISADRLHYQSDLFTNVGVVLALVLSSYFGLTLADPIIAGLIALYILKTAASIGIDSYNVLLDRELPDEDRARIKAIVLAHPKVLGMHDLRTRSSGFTTFIQLHMDLDPDTSLRQAQPIAEQVERGIRAAFPGAEIIVHQDPAGLAEPDPPLA